MIRKLQSVEKEGQHPSFQLFIQLKVYVRQKRKQKKSSSVFLMPNFNTVAHLMEKSYYEKKQGKILGLSREFPVFLCIKDNLTTLWASSPCGNTECISHNLIRRLFKSFIYLKLLIFIWHHTTESEKQQAFWICCRIEHKAIMFCNKFRGFNSYESCAYVLTFTSIYGNIKYNYTFVLRLLRCNTLRLVGIKR